MKKFAGNLITFLCALGILWILVSWADVIAHNTTYQQKEQYGDMISEIRALSVKQ